MAHGVQGGVTALERVRACQGLWCQGDKYGVPGQREVARYSPAQKVELSGEEHPLYIYRHIGCRGRGPHIAPEGWQPGAVNDAAEEEGG